MIQLQFLNYILNSKDFSIVTKNNINEDFFSEYKDEFKFIRDHYYNYNNVPDKASFLNEFPNFEIIKVEENTTYLLKKLYEDKNTNTLVNTFNSIKNLLLKNNLDEAMNVYLKMSDKLASNINLGCVDILNGEDRYKVYVDKCNDYGKYYVKTGFPELDALIGGWDRNEELATIAARSGTGKSWILLKVALAAAQQGLNVGIYSGEMSEIKVGYRIDTLLGHLSNGKIIHGNVDIQNEYKKYLDNLKSSIKGSIKVLTPAMINGSAGVNALRAFVENENLDMLCVDQHSLLEDDRKARNPVDKAANISKDLKILQTLKKIPIIAVSQQNRSAVSENGAGTENIAQSDRISQDSTIIIFLEQKEGVLTMKLAKARDSQSNKDLKYAVDWDKGYFEYIPVGEEKEKEKEYNDIKASYEQNSDVYGEEPF